MITILLLAAVLGIAAIVIITRIDWKKETEDMRDLFNSKLEDHIRPSIRETWDGGYEPVEGDYAKDANGI